MLFVLVLSGGPKSDPAPNVKFTMGSPKLAVQDWHATDELRKHRKIRVPISPQCFLKGTVNLI